MTWLSSIRRPASRPSPITASTIRWPARQPNELADGELFGYTGRPFDQATGLQNNLNRWTANPAGWWLSQDPRGIAGGDTNLYRYCGNSEINATDPSGVCETGDRLITNTSTVSVTSAAGSSADSAASPGSEAADAVYTDVGIADAAADPSGGESNTTPNAELIALMNVSHQSTLVRAAMDDLAGAESSYGNALASGQATAITNCQAVVAQKQNAVSQAQTALNQAVTSANQIIGGATISGPSLQAHGGLDVTNALNVALNALDTKFNALTDSQKITLCRNMIALPQAIFNAWNVSTLYQNPTLSNGAWAPAAQHSHRRRWRILGTGSCLRHLWCNDATLLRLPQVALGPPGFRIYFDPKLSPGDFALQAVMNYVSVYRLAKSLKDAGGATQALAFAYAGWTGNSATGWSGSWAAVSYVAIPNSVPSTLAPYNGHISFYVGSGAGQTFQSIWPYWHGLIWKNQEEFGFTGVINYN